MRETLLDDSTASVVSVTELQRKFPNLPPRLLVTLAVATLLWRTVTPFRLCQCGCGEPVHGKAHFASPACRKRAQRERDARKAGAPKQFNLVIQYEMPARIPTFPDSKPSAAASKQFSAPVPLPRPKTAEQMENLRATYRAGLGHWPKDLLRVLRKIMG